MIFILDSGHFIANFNVTREMKTYVKCLYMDKTCSTTLTRQNGKLDKPVNNMCFLSEHEN